MSATTSTAFGFARIAQIVGFPHGQTNESNPSEQQDWYLPYQRADDGRRGRTRTRAASGTSNPSFLSLETGTGGIGESPVSTYRDPIQISSERERTSISSLLGFGGPRGRRTSQASPTAHHFPTNGVTLPPAKPLRQRAHTVVHQTENPRPRHKVSSNSLSMASGLGIYNPTPPSSSTGHSNQSHTNRHPYALARSPEPQLHPPNRAPPINPAPATARHLKASVSTPNLRLGAYGNSSGSFQPPWKKYKPKPTIHVEAETWCDSFVFPRPRLVAHQITITPPDTPLSEKENPVARRQLQFLHPTNPENLPLPSPESELTRVIQEGEKLDKERQKWMEQAMNSLGNKRSRSASKSRARSRSRDGRELNNVKWGLVETITNSVFSQGHNGTISRHGSSSAGTRTASHSRNTSSSQNHSTGQNPRRAVSQTERLHPQTLSTGRRLQPRAKGEMALRTALSHPDLTTRIHMSPTPPREGPQQFDISRGGFHAHTRSTSNTPLRPFEVSPGTTTVLAPSELPGVKPIAIHIPSHPYASPDLAYTPKLTPSGGSASTTPGLVTPSAINANIANTPKGLPPGTTSLPAADISSRHRLPPRAHPQAYTSTPPPPPPSHAHSHSQSSQEQSRETPPPEKRMYAATRSGRVREVSPAELLNSPSRAEFPHHSPSHSGSSFGQAQQSVEALNSSMGSNGHAHGNGNNISGVPSGRRSPLGAYAYAAPPAGAPERTSVLGVEEVLMRGWKRRSADSAYRAMLGNTGSSGSGPEEPSGLVVPASSNAGSNPAPVVRLAPPNHPHTRSTPPPTNLLPTPVRYEPVKFDNTAQRANIVGVMASRLSPIQDVSSPDTTSNSLGSGGSLMANPSPTSPATANDPSRQLGHHMELTETRDSLGNTSMSDSSPDFSPGAAGIMDDLSAYRDLFFKPTVPLKSIPLEDIDGDDDDEEDGGHDRDSRMPPQVVEYLHSSLAVAGPSGLRDSHSTGGDSSGWSKRSVSVKTSDSLSGLRRKIAEDLDISTTTSSMGSDDGVGSRGQTGTPPLQTWGSRHGGLLGHRVESDLSREGSLADPRRVLPEPSGHRGEQSLSSDGKDEDYGIASPILQSPRSLPLRGTISERAASVANQDLGDIPEDVISLREGEEVDDGQYSSSDEVGGTEETTGTLDFTLRRVERISVPSLTADYVRPVSQHLTLGDAADDDEDDDETRRRESSQHLSVFSPHNLSIPSSGITRDSAYSNTSTGSRVSALLSDFPVPPHPTPGLLTPGERGTDSVTPSSLLDSYFTATSGTPTPEHEPVSLFAQPRKIYLTPKSSPEHMSDRS
ncbi:hypothetical protein SISSUDRAFT_1064566 [Sistotremastrum suecicum HHB10207 ss-3]|uniref:Uncharacterized protein n=1 Tax=Sistotremastrum suecicum HHB10207 ss-3 TaxID=1314776 RepID=A0A166AHD1_9AGAM|nr:hypothetical protein SISSUDRAFT_1064566 [Sistotremastrum suecicum HHB10207 ss-3]